MVTYECGASTDQIEPAAAGLGPFQDGEHIELPIILSANSIIVVEEKIYGYVLAINWAPNGAKWILKNPSNEAVYQTDSEIKVASTTPEPPWWWPFKGAGVYIFLIDIPDITVPWFPDQGAWKLELYLYDKFLGIFERNAIFATWHFSVGESSIVDNLFAPIYITWGGIPVVGWGAFSFALPGLFWITSPFWVLAILFIMLVFYSRSIKVAVDLIKEGGRRFKLAVKGGGKT